MTYFKKKKLIRINEKKILFLFWIMLLIHIFRYYLIIRGTPDFLSFKSTENKNWNFIELLARFSKQSIILVFFIITLKLFKKNVNKKWFYYLSFIALVDILLSCIIYNVIIDKFSSLKKFYLDYQYLTINFVEHVYFPIFYLIFFLFSNIKSISLKKNYISLIHPLFYFLIFVIISLYDPNFCKYPYSFMNPKIGKCLLKFIYNKEPKNWLGVFINCLFISFIIYLISFVLIKIKEYIILNNKRKKIL
ncbi:hypothetical protein [Candidatus Phytoplasma sacchari]|uniref:Integral membrane protein n=1 Tax=Candidatus Phytoplasma sacchari TaxID=2609813 RepID=A0ABY7M3A2_9MOLU|nr:hypothetical protein O7R10_02330 [Candidatus Phytoplasma sacchari]